MKYFPAAFRTTIEGLSRPEAFAANGHDSALEPIKAFESSLVQPSYKDPVVLRSHILIVDDDADIRLVLERMLRAAGYCVSSAEDGEAGWSALAADSYDLLITDHDMPKLLGLDLLRRLRAVKFDLPVILISGNMPWYEPDLLGLLQPGLALAKPFSSVDLMVNVRSLLIRARIAEPVFERPASYASGRDQSPSLRADWRAKSIGGTLVGAG